MTKLFQDDNSFCIPGSSAAAALAGAGRTAGVLDWIAGADCWAAGRGLLH
ncbi:MAG: hypothetical protein WA700_18865 [Acidobacteriaceae bacterium]